MKPTNYFWLRRAVLIVCWCGLSPGLPSARAAEEKLPVLASPSAQLSDEERANFAQRRRALLAQLAEFQAAARAFNAETAEAQTDEEFNTLQSKRSSYIAAAKAFDQDVGAAEATARKRTETPDLRTDTPSDKKVMPGSAGYNVAKVHLATVAGVKPGTDTKAGDQLVAAGKIAEANGDLKPIYEGGATAAGSLPVPTMPPEDPTTFSTRVRNDSRMVEALAGLNAAKANRGKVTAELAEVTARMQRAKTPQEMSELHQQLEQKNVEFNATLLAVTAAEEKVRKVHRTIDAEVAPPVAAP